MDAGFRASVLDRLRKKSDWPEYLWSRFDGLDGLIAEIEKSLVAVVGGKLGDAPPTAAGSSKVGGIPDVPAGFVWPSEDDGGPLAFICQVNLGEVPAGAKELPHAGMLYLFSIADGDRAYGHEIDDATAKLLFVAEPGALSPATPPDDLEAAAIEERALTLGASFVCEERDDDGYPVSKRFDGSIESAIDEAIDACGGCAVDGMRMLGNAHIFRSEYRAHFDPETQTLLLGLSGYGVAQDAFGEGSFRIVIDRAALASGKLGEGSLLFEPGT